MNNWSAEAWRMVVDSAPEGVVVCDAAAADHPVVYANAAFAAMSGYAIDALLGKNLRILQGNDREQEGLQSIREAVERGEAARVLLRNYRPDGSLFWNEVLIQPVRNPGGQLTHFVAYYRDASERLKDGEKTARGLPRGCGRIGSPGCIPEPTSRSCCNATGSWPS